LLSTSVWPELRVSRDRVLVGVGSQDADVSVHLDRPDSLSMMVINQPIAFFIPEHMPDPSMRPAGEQLWVEVTIPARGPPRPIRLGVSQADGSIVPLVIGAR
jgi:hypothetical protein